KEIEDPQDLEPGDVICYDFSGDGRFDHNTIVVAKDVDGYPLVNAHTDNSRHRYWLYEDSLAWTPNCKYKFFRIDECCNNDAFLDLTFCSKRVMNMVLYVVLHELLIPTNTGHIARICLATRAVLHLSHPLVFSIDDKMVRRAGLDYWQYVDVRA